MVGIRKEQATENYCKFDYIVLCKSISYHFGYYLMIVASIVLQQLFLQNFRNYTVLNGNVI